MANEVGTASNFEDLFGKIVSFLTTNTDLVTAGQEWEVLRIQRDNLLSLTTNMVDTGTNVTRKIIHTCRYDARSLNINNRDTSDGRYTASFTAGTSQITFRLRAVREVKSVLIRSSGVVGEVNTNPTAFRLQYSDNGTTWTTALTVTGSTSWQTGERRTYAVPGTPGTHEYWRIIWDGVQTGTTIRWAELLLLQNDGTVANHFGSEVLFKAPGNAGTDEIYTGIRSEYDAAAGWYNLFLNGYAGYDPDVKSFFNEPGGINPFGSQTTVPVPMVPLWNSSMPYWFSASGRSFRFGVKVDTVYSGGYLGFFLPYATPGQYPYPLMVGGALVPQDSPRSAEWRYSYVNWRHAVFPGPGGNNADSDLTSATAYLRMPDGLWKSVANRPNSGTSVPDGIRGLNHSITSGPSGAARSMWPHCMNDQWTSGKLPYRDCLGGGYVIQPCIILQRLPEVMVFGELEGVFNISGFGVSSEDTAVFGGVTHVAFQNAYRNTVHEYWALSLN
jgi:hypothetical protein